MRTSLGPISFGPPRRDRRVGSLGWIGVLASIGFALIGKLLAELSSGTILAVSGALLGASALMINWARIWVRESREPFPYTFSVGEFELAPDPEDEAAAKATERLAWIQRDLISHLSTRVQRLSYSPQGPAEGQPTTPTDSHLHISGWYGVRRIDADQPGEEPQWQLEVSPQVRLGATGAPAKLGRTVVYELVDGNAKKPPILDPHHFRAVFERVYWSVASQIYKQIARGVEAKIKLLPPGRLRAAAYLSEADDYATSNTLDAYGAARDLYRSARAEYDVSARRRPTSPWRIWIRSRRESLDRIGRVIRRRLSQYVGAAGKRDVMTARAEIGEAGMLISEWHLEQLCGTLPREIFHVLPLVGTAIDRLEGLESDIEHRDETLFRGHLTLAMAQLLLSDAPGAAASLRKAYGKRPIDARRNAEFLFVTGMVEPTRLRSLRLLRHAVELDSTLELAHFYGAERSEEIWHARERFEPTVASLIDEEYKTVVTIDPGNVAAWANRGNIAWLLDKEGREPEWRRQALLRLNAGRQYKEVRREAVVAELDWSLARLAAEAGEFPQAYAHYIATVSAHLDSPLLAFSADFAYGNAGEALVDRFHDYRTRVEAHAEGPLTKHAPESRLVESVLAFVLNDYGLAYQAYHARSGDEEALQKAIEAFEGACDLNDSFVLPAFNLARLEYRNWERESSADEEEDARRLEPAAGLLKDVLRREPGWVPAELLLVEIQSQRAAKLESAKSALVGEGGEPEASFASAAAELADPSASEGGARLSLELAQRECHKDIKDQLASLLPHDYFVVPGQPQDGAAPEGRLDALGTFVPALLADLEIDWSREFSQVHVAALIEWAKALAADSASALPALELCMQLRESFYEADEQVLAAQRNAATKLLNQPPAEGGPSEEELHATIADCERLLEAGYRRILTNDPAHYGLISGPALEWFPADDQRVMLLNAIDAKPSPATKLAIGNRFLGLEEQAHGG